MQSMLPPGRNRKRSLALFGGLCFFLSALEYMIPKPLPFIRLGLANLPLLLALDIFPFSYYMLLVALKVCGQALISGTLFSYVFLFSAGGTGVSALLMYALRLSLGKEKISLIGVSAAGALASNGVTLVLAYFFVFGSGVRYAAAPVLALGIVTGTLLGAACEYFTGRSLWYARVVNGAEGGTDLSDNARSPAARSTVARSTAARSFAARSTAARSPAARSPDSAPGKGNAAKASPAGKPERFRKAREAFCLKTFASGDLAAAGLCMAPALLFNPDTHTRIVQFLFFFLLAWLCGKKNNLLISVSVMLGIVLFNLLVPYGEILFSIGAFNITKGALMGGIRRAVTLEALLMLSRSCVRKDLVFPGAFGEIAGESLRIFSAAAEGKQFFKGPAAKPDSKTLAERLDELLFSLDGAQCEDEAAAEKKSDRPARDSRVKAAGYGSRLILAAVVFLAWLPFLAAFMA